MYYVIYGLLYVVSLLPFFILYGISDLFAFSLYHIIRYRREVVLGNLDIAFPDKPKSEKIKIAKRFYRNLTDTFIEMIKLLSISEKSFFKRVSMNLDECNALASKGKNIQFHSGHQFSWEYGNWIIAKKLSIPWIGVYMKINNKAVDKIFYDLRSKMGSILIAAQEFKSRMHKVFNKQYSLGLVADQNPGVSHTAYWLNFFGKATPFITGPEKGATRNGNAVVFVKLLKEKRGVYKLVPKIITENAAAMKEGELTLLYRNFLEDTIRENPDNYLWSHRRWKWDYQPEYKNRWIDHVSPPSK